MVQPLFSVSRAGKAQNCVFLEQPRPVSEGNFNKEWIEHAMQQWTSRLFPRLLSPGSQAMESNPG